MADREYMMRAIELAKKGAGWTSPNPMVGAVVVKDGRIIAEGYHERCGEYHAERNALLRCKEDPTGATMYVTLEPCCHHGKTPPCTEIILDKKIARVVIGSRDPNPLVAGKGAQILRDGGVEVEEDFLRAECDAINPVFFHYITTGMPYGVLKFAMTLDGKIATRTGASKWVTGEIARQHVHSLRGRYSAILAGIGTALADDPMLNCRLDGAHQPIRVIVDGSLRLPVTSQLAKTAREYRTVVAGSEERFRRMPEMAERKAALEECGIEVMLFPETGANRVNSDDLSVGSAEAQGIDLEALFRWLGQQKVDSVFIEGGGTINESALRQGLIQHVYAYVAPKIFGGKEALTPVEGLGVSLPDEATMLTNSAVTPLGEDLLLEFDVIQPKGGD